MARRSSGDDRVVGDDGLPPAPDHLVERRSLLEQLDGLVGRPVTLVTAPAGFGKTTLVAHWCRSRCAARYVWMQPDDVDVEPERLVAAIVHAATGTDLRTTDGEWVAADRQRLEPDAIGRLAAMLGGAPESVIVVDGVDTAGPVGVLSDIATAFARARECGAHLVVVGRRALPADMLPFQLRGRAARIGASHLELEAAELADVVSGYAGQPIGTTVAVELTDRLEGWMTGAVLVGISCPANGDAHTVDELMNAAFDDLGGYVDVEILSRVGGDPRELLILTACLDVVPSALCDLMLERNDSEQLLTEMRASGLPLTRHMSPAQTAAGPGWFRCLRPVREVLDHRLARHDRATRERFLHAAATWFSEQQRLAEAAECWARVGDWNQVGDLIIDHSHQLLHADDIGWLVGLVQQIPPSVIRERLNLALIGAWVLRMDGRVGSAYELLAVYEPYMTQLGRTVADVIRAGVVSWIEDAEGALGFANAAIVGFDELGADAYEDVSSSMRVATAPSTATFRALAQGHALLASSYGARWEGADQYLVDVTPDSVVTLQQVWIVNLHGERASFLALGGRVTDAFAAARQALVRAADSDLVDHRAAADAHYAFGEASRLALDHHEAAEAFGRAQRLAEVNDRRNLLAAIAASHAHLLVDRGDADAALSSLQHLAADHHRPPPTIAGLLAAAEARALAHVGAHRRAMQKLDRVEPTAVTATARVAVALAIGDLAVARDSVARWPNEPTVDSAVRRALADAAIAERGGEPAEAGPALHAALAAAVDHRLLQPFIEYGPLMARLLARIDRGEAGTAEQELARQVDAIIRSGSVASVAPQFTAREAIVLAHLTAGLQLRAIANEMHLSINTVKTHLKAIYRKLGVNNRADAVAVWHGSSLPDLPD